ncbi:MAG: D-alanyl-D-alanine carboxypeptidase [Clostridia bacterium]|nr:D-alanyl-D-alanine carboxypeptidase [Clostridia bacterium]
MRGFARISIFIALFMLLVPAAFATSEKPLEAVSEGTKIIENVAAAAVYNIENDTVVFSYHADDAAVTGSLTKLMTAVCAYELLQDRLDEKITVTSDMVKGMTMNFYGYKAGNEVVVRDMFGGMLARGYNDCAHILACLAKGSVEGFVAYMNEKAAEWGMKNTVYVNATGLDKDGMTTTASDSLIVARKFYEIPFLTSISNSMNYEGEVNFSNRNEFLLKGDYFDSDIIAMNYGWTANSLSCAASATEGEGLSYIIVVLGGQNVDSKDFAYLVTSYLADKALSEFGYVDVIKKGKVVCEVPVELSTDADYVTLVGADSLTLYLPLSVDISTDLVYSYRLSSEKLTAPVTEGQIVGSYTVSRDGVILGSVDLVTKNSLGRSEFLKVLDSIEKFTTSTFFIVTLIALVVLTIAYFVVGAIVRHRRRNRRLGRR